MRKTIYSVGVLLGLLTLTSVVQAQGMMGLQGGMMGQNYIYANTQQNIESSETAKDEAEGKVIWEKLQNKEIDCKSITDDDYDLLGDFFMGQMAGYNHEAMNERMVKVMGDQGEKQMHIVMGKRFSGCDVSAVLPAEYQGFSSFMPMMDNFNNLNYPMMRNSFDNKKFAFDKDLPLQHGYIFMPIICAVTIVLVWAFLILSCAALIHYIKGSKRK